MRTILKLSSVNGLADSNGTQLTINDSILISTASIPVPIIPGGKVGDEGAIVSLVYGDKNPTTDEDQDSDR